MKEVKEQCEEQIEEVTKKGNEASRDLSEHKEQSQQVIADFAAKDCQKVFLPLSRHFVPWSAVRFALFSALPRGSASSRHKGVVLGC